MVPLTSSLYVPGRMEDNQNVLVEVGAGYFIEESTPKARAYCERKMKLINKNAQKASEVIQIKRLQMQKVNTEYQKRLDQLA